MEHPPTPQQSNALRSDSTSADSRSHDLASAPPHLVAPKATLITDLQKVTFLHDHPLIPFTSFVYSWCHGCGKSCEKEYIYGGYRCNEMECDGFVVFHKDCVKPLQEINHSSHPQHSLKLVFHDSELWRCVCGEGFRIGYSCSICDFKLDLFCAKRLEPFVLPGDSYGHEHPLQLSRHSYYTEEVCEACRYRLYVPKASRYRCNQQCNYVIHVDCADLFPEVYHSSHPQHPLMSLKSQVPHYADKRCVLCGEEYGQLYHCDVCNFSTCKVCMKYPPPLDVECPTTHEHQLRLVPRLIDFTCNICGTQGHRSPYFCLQCNFMIHRQCIGLPRVININRHNHRVTYIRRLGHGEWKCRVCREKVDVFYGAYTCEKCPTLVVHALCATRADVWDMVEREGTPEEEEIAPFEVIDDYTISHFSHDHNLRINRGGLILPESTLCVACVFQICSEPFYSCEQCDFILHEKCAHLPRKKRHAQHNQPFTLHTEARYKTSYCNLCGQYFSGFSYEVGSVTTLCVRCATTSDSLYHESHQHPLYYSKYGYSDRKHCSQCWSPSNFLFGCSKCDYFLDGKCALLPRKVIKKRYDDHPLFLCFGDMNAYGEYWCEACERKIDKTKWYYTCNDCGTTLHASCVVGDFSYVMPSYVTERVTLRFLKQGEGVVTRWDEQVVSNNSICRQVCRVCKFRCKSPILKLSRRYEAGDDIYICSHKCKRNFRG